MCCRCIFTLAKNFIVKFIYLLIFFIISSNTNKYNYVALDTSLHLCVIYCIIHGLLPALPYHTNLSLTPCF